jgi:hypothetical protein
LSPWNPRQIEAQNANGERRRHEERANPETPATMHSFAPGAWARLTDFVTISFPVVPVSCHLFSIATSYSAWHSLFAACAVIQVFPL